MWREGGKFPSFYVYLVHSSTTKDCRYDTGSRTPGEITFLPEKSLRLRLSNDLSVPKGEPITTEHHLSLYKMWKERVVSLDSYKVG